MVWKMMGILLVIVILVAPLHTIAQNLPLPPDLAVISPENAHQLVEVARIGNGQIVSAAWSPDGEKIAVASTVGVWMLDSLALPPHLLEGQTGVARSVTFSPDGRLLAAGDQHGTVFLWHGVSGALLKRYPSELGAIAKAAFSPDMTLIAATDTSGSVDVWNIATGELVFQSQAENDRGIMSDILFSPNGQYVAWSVDYPSGDGIPPGDLGFGAWRLADIQSNQQLFRPEWHVAQYNQPPRYLDSTIRFSPTSEPLILTSSSAEGNVFEVQYILQNFWTGEIVEQSPDQIGFNNALYGTRFFHEQLALFIVDNLSLHFSTSSDVYGTSYASVSYWTPKITHIATTPDRERTGEIIPDRHYILIAYENGQVELWSISPEGMTKIWSRNIRPLITAIALDASVGDVRMLIGTSSGDIQYYVGLSAFGGEVLKAHTEAITGLSFVQATDAISSVFVSSSEDGTIRLWDMASAQPGEIIVQTENDIGNFHLIRNLHFDSELQRLIYSIHCFRDTELCFTLLTYNLTDSQTDILFDPGDTEIRDGVFSHDKSKFAMVDGFLYGFGFNGVTNDSMVLWDTNSGQQLGTLWENDYSSDNPAFFDTILKLQFSPDDRLLAATYGDCMAMGCGARQYYGFFRIWDVETQRELVTISDHTSEITSAAFTADGKLLITGSYDGTVRFWGVPSAN